MSAQVKHSGDPAAEKPDRRRGAAGRAAALRRAPSDSDCSGETASLSADSGERRPPPPPPRGKTRNRRRGSEWEVLEGLKDGQRFERRPEVFNGFLHKKRKWPLKGWHKRFFVVDGGILVYARSPTDVARGRLHGSLDVGLSVISAKPRRRRIDIDADEFIYHLRAKTPDVFRTWLNVLKAHRLYRQHLLTFGARESVPKIHAPHDDLPPTDTSSHTSESYLKSSIIKSQTNTNDSYRLISSELASSVYEKSGIASSLCKTDERFFIQLENFDSNEPGYDSLCSSYYIEKRQNELVTSPKIPSTDEQQIDSTDLDLNTFNSSDIAAVSANELKSNKSLALNSKRSKILMISKQRHETQHKLNTLESINTRINVNDTKKSTVWLDNKDQTALYFFSRKRRHRNRSEEDYHMKRSRKSTNLVKYRNSREEPCLTKPELRQLLLSKYKRNIIRTAEDKHVNTDLYKNDKKIDKSTQDAITTSEYDLICEKLVLNLFDNLDHDINPNGEGVRNSSIYINLVVKELYDLKLNNSKKHPIKSLFKSLIQFFLKNTEGKFKGSIKQDIGTDTPSNSHFSRDIAVSNIMSNTYKRIQESEEIEKLINSTIYGCSIVKGNKSKEADIAITKTLINNLDTSTSSTTFSNIAMEDNYMNRTDSTELPLLQKYFKHILSETSLSKAVAKDFLNAYLNVLDHPSKSATSIVSSEISRSISPCKTNTCVGDTIENPTDQSPLKIKDMLDKVMDLFTNNKVNQEHNEYDGTVVTVTDNTDTVRKQLKCEDLSSKCMSGTINDHKIVIDLTKYDIDNIALSNSASALEPKFITINLKEKISHSNNSKLIKSTVIPAGTSDKTKAASDNPESSHSHNSKLIKSSIFPAGTSDETKAASDNPESSLDYQTYIEKKEEHNKKPQVDNDEVDVHTLPTSSGATSKANLNITFDDVLDEIPYPNCKENTQCFFLSSIHEDVPVIQEKLDQSHDFISRRLAAQTSMDKSGVVDEDFIFRILENLIVLSRNIPGINRDLKSFYMQSKKASDIANLPGLSLLGKIYRKENKRKSTNYNHINAPISTEIRRNVNKKAIEIAVNTSHIFPSLKTVEDRALSAIFLAKALANIAVQTLSLDDEVNERQIEIDNKDEWFQELTQEYIKNNTIKCMLRKYQHLPQSLRIAHPIRAKLPDRFSIPNNSSAIFKELSNLSPPLMTSNGLQKNNVEQLSKRTNSKHVRAESMTDSSVCNTGDDWKTLYRCTSEPSWCSGLISPNGGPIRGPQAGFVSGTPGGRLAGWIVESGGPLESASRELGQAQLSVQQLQRLLDAMLELQNIHHHDTDVSLEGASPSVKKDRRKFGLRKKKSNSKCASVELAPLHVDGSSSHMALSALTAPPSPGGGASSMPNSAASLPIACAAARPQSLPGAEALSVGAGGGPASLTSLTPDHQLREDFTILAKDLVANLKTVVSTLVVERGRLRAAMEAAEPPAAGGVVAALRTNLTSALHQNSELRSRLSRIHDASDLAEISSVGNNSDQQAPRPFPKSLSYSSSCVSASEFFDAEEHDDEFKPAAIIATDEAGVIELDGDSSSEAGSLSSEEGSASSDNSDGATSAVIPAERTPLQNGSEQLPTICTRRSRLPCPRPTPASPSLWNLLYKNIGKDLSQISMPVTINEPLNMLQRLCEELEYSELLDSASSCNNELERMSLIAAFAVSAYAASAHRAASKPFNPLLAETYEYVRGDRDFRFIAEQVSHHPPISACHAESPRWTFWQEARIKTKFWGKSMEFQPTGRVHVRLTPSGDHYSWNKVTTCVHNLFGGQRWVDQYGDMHIVCHGTDITCKLQFIKASSWSSSRHEVRGVVAVGGAPRMRLQGRWSEGLQGGERTLWRPGAMPPDYELYYGFTRFAMELNELAPGMRDVLPPTDTRLRPDQRALEEGDVDAAEQFKHELEQGQRERRRDGIEHTPLWFRKTIEDGEETWIFTGEYWKAREAGFSDTPRLW